MNTPSENIQSGGIVDVLVVDDDADAVEELVEFLGKAKLKCASAGDGWLALKLLAEGCRPTVVVTDLRMPELDGMEFVVRLKGLVQIDPPEVIFISGHAGFDDAIAAIRLGARDMLTKPIDGPTLVRAVRSAQLSHQMRTRSPMQAAVPADGIPRRGEGPSPGERKRAALKDLKTMRRLRSQHFPSELFSDPCWEMLLDLYDAFLTGSEVTVTSLGVASGVPQTTALRRMETLQGHGLIVRLEDEADKRRTIIRLTDSGLAAVERFFENYLARRSS
jgi:CheY-like chemotaxis protein/DNA-binding MarR family transcriptional regulator